MPSVLAQAYHSLNDDQKKINELLSAYQSASSDSLKGILGYQLASIYYKNNQQKSSQFYLKQANRFVKDNSYLKALSYYYNHAMHPLPIDADANALKSFKQSYILVNQQLKKFQTPKAYAIRSTVLFNLALVYQRQNNDFEAIKILLDHALPVAKKANDAIEVANIYRFLGLIFYNKNDMAKAHQYVHLAIETLERKPLNHENYAEDLLAFYLFYVEILSQEQQFDAADYYLSKAQKMLALHPESNMQLDYYSAQGSLLHQSQDFRSAIMAFDKGIQKAQQEQDAYSVLNFKLLKFESLKAMQDFEAAKEILLEVLNDKQVNIEDQKNYTKELASIYGQLNDFSKALAYSERYIELSDSLETHSGTTEIMNLEAKFKNQENERKIKALQFQKRQALLTAQYDRLNHIVFGLICFILFLATLLLVKNFKAQKRIAAQKEINYLQNLQALQTQKEIEVMQASMMGEEAERKRIARDLHDGIGSRLSALKMELQAGDKLQEHTSSMESISDSLSRAITELRQVAFNLMPETLLKLGLEMALRDLCFSLNSEKCQITFQAHQISDSMKSDDQVAIFRIVQELINNALKHAEATEIIVDCSQNKGLFLITVEDNGRGFNTDDLAAYAGLGLKNIKNRIELLSGKFEVDSQLGVGTLINIELLLQDHEQYKI
ncbi:hypothetical protein G4D82_10070 [Flavobacterium sp. CYK-4]|uniref:tetratricopeptide repeat-containing sensor histidine kinase n=1 Tax=Flavobacterium lotistagni TaxID=2709660 RepID=UPI00140D99C7|nr:sensor histidine kinase [Flavobacterium lotistagni]NHM07567.1 hypothetical protein [Flavobacterium lotistagni]